MRVSAVLIGSLEAFPSIPRAPAVAAGASGGTLRLRGGGFQLGHPHQVVGGRSELRPELVAGQANVAQLASAGNAWAYGARAFRAVAGAHGVTLKLTRPHRPQTNGKAERFIQTLRNEWAYTRRYRSNPERLHQLPRWLYRYSARRPHSGIDGAVPTSRL